MKRIFSLFTVILVLSSCTSKFSKLLKSKDNEYKLKMGEQFYAQKQYDKAQQLFEDVFPFIKGTPRYEEVYYKYAYCAYFEKDYMNAENLFKTYTENFPNGSKGEECEYMRAYSFYKQSPKVDLDQTNTSKTMALMQAFINTHPASERNKDATQLLDICRRKLELKEYKSAELYYDLGHYKAAAIAFSTLMEDYPDSDKSDEYKLNIIKSYYYYANLSFYEKQQERYEKVLTECADFNERFPDSKLKTQVNSFKTLSNNSIKNLQNEQIKATTQR